MKASDGKMRLTDCADTEQLLRIIQSIPSKKAEPFKMWLAKVGNERLDEMAAPEKGIERSVSYYKSKGYSDKWIQQRMRSIEIRKELEAKLGHRVTSPLNAKDVGLLDDSSSK